MRTVGYALLAVFLGCAAPGPDLSPEVIWVTMRTVELEGVTPRDLEVIRRLPLQFSTLEGGLVEPRSGLPVSTITVGELGSGEERRVGGSLIQLLVETITAHYAREERVGTRVDITQGALDRVLAGDPTLVIRVRATPTP